ncbi:MAG TPA: TonB family protein [Candidatus Polarisedimenticolia bacterium]|nr:TonB family protein [Candidatus Polarisedimenticolia bacterium]
MGYQALLFCPDEKTARTVTQVLSELDFEVVSCSEPFAAVKKLMGQHFDAVVVDCDNEQNATLLFKSARNSPNNQSALAVAVVEGQAGVAKAFRIGANLVLTKPINVEQAKGTLRVARGLLRKNEGTKAAATTTAPPPKPAASTPLSAKPTLVPSVASTRPLSAVTQVPAPAPKPAPIFSASAFREGAESGQTTESVKAESEQVASATPVATPVSEPKPVLTVGKSAISTPPKVSAWVGLSSGAASAPAPAREAAPSAVTSDKPVTVIPEPEPVGKSAMGPGTSAVQETVSPPHSFTFGGTVGSEAESASGGSKKTFIAVAAVILIAVSGYLAWTHFAHSSAEIDNSGPAAAQPALAAATPQAKPSATASVPPSAPPSATTASAPSAAQSTVSAKASVVSQTIPGAGNGQTHQSKASAGTDSPKSAASDVAENEVPIASAASEPIVVRKSAPEAPRGKVSPISEAPAPSITAIASSDDGGSLSNLLGNPSKAPAPVLQTLSISQGVSQGLAIKKTPPSYPPSALRMRIEGPVQLLATITRKGDISAVKILSGDPSLARAASDAVKQWKYRPYMLDGSPVEIQTQITVNFKLPR